MPPALLNDLSCFCAAHINNAHASLKKRQKVSITKQANYRHILASLDAYCLVVVVVVAIIGVIVMVVVITNALIAFLSLLLLLSLWRLCSDVNF